MHPNQRPSSHSGARLLRAAGLALAAIAPCAAQSASPAPAPTATPERIHTSRAAGAQLLTLPKEDDAFAFVVFGDRTGGPAEGIKVLEQAVADTNLLDPDLVLTVGDLINGYNAHDAWHAQAAEYKAAMAKLRMPWFPVAGNHDVYWRGEGRPPGEHESNFEAVFGPLWYAVQHKQCWFVVLYSDEGDPKTGRKDFNDPECQRMSPAQFEWLGRTLEQAKGAQHVFVFLHHPRWLARYGGDWDRVHALLARAANVTAVFAGHIHCMRFDGTKDGIQYYTVASVGAHLGMDAPAAGYLHQFHVVTVRPQGIVVAALPVGTVMDPQAITGQISDDAALLHAELRAEVASCVAAGDEPPLRADGTVDAVVTLRVHNPATRAIDLELIPIDGEPWVFGPDHQHLVVPPRQAGTTTFAVRRRAEASAAFALPRLEIRCDYLAADRRIGLPRREQAIDLPPPADLGTEVAARDGALVLDGRGACLAVPSDRLALPDGPFTVEAWALGSDFAGRRALVAKTENSEFSLFCSDGQASFSVRLGAAYATAKSAAPVLQTDRWHHLAGVFDGSEVRCYVDGALVGKAPALGARTTNALPLYVGADPNGRGEPVSFFAGRIDEVRITRGVVYAGERFAPAERLDATADTVLLLHLDRDFGPWSADASAQRAHAVRRGTAHSTVESQPALR
jgi:hypothetical protein